MIIMDTDSTKSIKWSSQLSVLSTGHTVPLRGDKIILPPSTLEQLLSASTVTVSSADKPQTSSFDSYNPYSYAAERQARAQLVETRQELPHPLTFRLVNPLNGRVCYAGIREFSAEEDFVGLSPFLRNSLGFEDSSAVDTSKTLSNGSNAHQLPNQSELKLTVHFEELPKGTYVRLRPLEAGYDPENWKALLEKHLRDNFTTLTNGEVLTVTSGTEEFRFLVDGLRPNDKAVTLVDTDLEVDIEPLNEDQARETLKRRALRAQQAPGTAEGSSSGGLLQIGQEVAGRVRPGDYVDYIIEEWNRTSDLELELSPSNDEREIDIFLTPAGPKQRSRPREDEHVFADFSSNSSKRIKVRHSNVELENAELLWISVRAYEGDDSSSQSPILAPVSYLLRVNSTTTNDGSSATPEISTQNPEEEICTNCHQSVPKRTMFLHQNFCLRNNISCPTCHTVFQKSSAEWKNHWHCPHDTSHGTTPFSHQKHDALYHTPRTCPACGERCSSTSDLSHHRTKLCPSKPILCQFCHLLVPQRGPDDPELTDPEVLMSGLTPHELIDGARTTECHLCFKIVRLRDMATHLKHHDYERLSRSPPIVCGNTNCGRTIAGYFSTDGKRTTRGGGQKGLFHGREICSTCFGPLYSNTYDPEGKALTRRVERRYLTQLMSGCGKSWCGNARCKTGRSNTGLEPIREMKNINAEAKALLAVGGVQFCTDEGGQRRREMAEMVAAEKGEGDGFVGGRVVDDGVVGEKGKGKEKGGKKTDRRGLGGYDVGWCVNALEVEKGDLLKARGWLREWAVSREEGYAREQQG
ncbi:hypothetical protein XPA_006935 [Xanthoria parietina]